MRDFRVKAFWGFLREAQNPQDPTASIAPMSATALFAANRKVSGFLLRYPKHKSLEVDVPTPALGGESITEGTIAEWTAKAVMPSLFYAFVEGLGFAVLVLRFP